MPLFRGTLGFGDAFAQVRCHCCVSVTLYINDNAPLTFHTSLNFIKANIKSQGSLTSDLGDILAGVRHLKHGEGLSFGDRVGIWGGSFGGYMTMRALAVTDVFQVCLP